MIRSSNHFPLQEHAYWTGYYSSKPAIKGLIRRDAATLRQAEQAVLLATALTGGTTTTTTAGACSTSTTAPSADGLCQMREATAITQHHDAVTGTAKKAVDVNYTAMLRNGSAAARCEA